MLNKDEIIKAAGVHPLKVKNIYVFGSRVYGTATADSDYDVIVVANSMEESKEVVVGELNIHVWTPDKFIRDLKNLDMHNLECVFAPDKAKILEKVNYMDANFKIKPDQMKFAAMQQSFNRFHTAKMKLIDGDIHRGVKSLFHSLRILLFAKQILRYGRIEDFTEANQFWSDIKIDLQLTKNITDGEELWRYFKDKYLPQKIELEQRLKNIQ
jgi:predicted nucleotidyltransferase